MDELKKAIKTARKGLQNYSMSLEDAYCLLYNETMEYSYDLEWIFNDYVTKDVVEEILKSEIKKGWIERVYFFLWEVNPCSNNLFRINGYWNLEEVDSDDIENLIDTLEYELVEKELNKLEDKVEKET